MRSPRFCSCLALAAAVAPAVAQSFTIAFSDTSIVYNPPDAWNTKAAVSEHVAYTNVSGATATLLFKGTQVSVSASKKYDRGNMLVYIDGVQVATVSQNIAQGTGNIETLWTSSKLGDTNHNVTIADGAQSGQPQYISFSSFTYLAPSNQPTHKNTMIIAIAAGVGGGVVLLLLLIGFWQWRVYVRRRNERTDLDHVRPYQTAAATEVIDASTTLKPTMVNATPAEQMPLASYDPRQSLMFRHSSSGMSGTSADTYAYMTAAGHSPESPRIQSWPSSQVTSPLLAGRVIPFAGPGVDPSMGIGVFVPHHVEATSSGAAPGSAAASIVGAGSNTGGAGTSQGPSTGEGAQASNVPLAPSNPKAVYAIQNANEEGDEQIRESPPQYGS